LNLELFLPTVFVVTALVATFLVRRDLMSLALAGFACINAATTALLIARGGTLGFLQLRYNMRAMPVVLVGIAWLFLVHRGRAQRIALWLAALSLLLAALPLTWHRMRTDPRQY